MSRGLFSGWRAWGEAGDDCGCDAGSTGACDAVPSTASASPRASVVARTPEAAAAAERVAPDADEGVDPGAAPLLDVDVRDKRFGARRVLRDIRLALAAGEIVGLVGASGCGKSTLLRIVAGLDREFAGAVRLAGRVQDAPAREIGFIFQEPRLFPWCSVAANVAFSAGGEAGARRHAARVSGLLAEVGLAGYERALPKQLSGGQAQRVALARGLFDRPRVLLLDEPFSAVDAFTRMRLQDVLTTLVRRHAIGVLMVTHDIDEAAWLSDRVVVLEADPGRLGEVVDIAAPRPRPRDDDAVAGARRRVFEALQAAHAF